MNSKRSVSSRSAGRARKKRRSTSQTEALTAAELDVLHDAGEDLTAHLDVTRARRPGREVQRVNVDFHVDLLKAIDRTGPVRRSYSGEPPFGTYRRNDRCIVDEQEDMP